MRYTVNFPITEEMGPCSFSVKDTLYQTKEEDALWHYNKAREHDGLAPLNELPDYTEFNLIES